MTHHRPARRPSSRLAWVALALALSACQAPTTPPTGKKPDTLTSGGGSLIAAGGGNLIAAGGGNMIAAGAGNAVPTSQGGGLVAAGGGNAVGNVVPGPAMAAPSAAPAARGDSTGLVAAGSLNFRGQVALPAGIVAAGGLNLVAAGGGNIVAAGGLNMVAAGGGNLVHDGGVALYRLHALPQQVTVKGATVVLLDAQGAPVKDSAGKPFEAKTDDEGRYGFVAAPPPGALVASVKLAAGFGELRAIVPAAGPNEARVGNLDVTSTLTAGHVLGEVLKDAPDKQAALDRLTPSLNAETNTQMAKALDQATVAPPAKLTDEVTASTVAAVKAAVPALAAKLEEVRKALIVAGQADLGAGRAGSDVSVKAPHQLALGPDGSLFVASWDQVVYRLKPDGTVAKAVGLGTYQAGASPDGVKADEAKLERLPHVAVDAQGRVVAMEEGGRVTRVEADGKLKQLLPGFQPYVWAAGLTTVGDRVAVFTGDTRTDDVTLTYVEPTGLTSVAHVFKQAELGIYEYEAIALGADAQGRLYVGSSAVVADRVGGQKVRRIEPGSFAVSTVASTPTDGAELTVAPDGTIVTLAAGARTLTLRKPDGASQALAGTLPAELMLGWNQGAAIAADGKLYLGREAQVWRLAGGTFTRVLGTEATAGGQAADLALEEPRGLAADGDGTLYVADRWKKQIVAITPTGTTRRVAGGGQGVDGSPADGAALGPVSKLAKDAAGTLYFLENETTVREVRSDALHTVAPTITGGLARAVKDFVAAPDGTLAWVEVDHTNQALPASLWLRPAGQAARQLASLPGTTAAWAIARGADGTLWVAGGGTLYRLPAGGSLETLKAAPQFDCAYGIGMAVDAQGRIVKPHYNQIVRYDAAADAFTVLAGPEGRKFTGSDVADGLQWPSYPTFAPNGDLLIADTNHKQVKRVLAADLN